VERLNLAGAVVGYFDFNHGVQRTYRALL
jgi:hypothetical protein